MLFMYLEYNKPKGLKVAKDDQMSDRHYSQLSWWSMGMMVNVHDGWWTWWSIGMIDKGIAFNIHYQLSTYVCQSICIGKIEFASKTMIMFRLSLIACSSVKWTFLDRGVCDIPFLDVYSVYIHNLSDAFINNIYLMCPSFPHFFSWEQSKERENHKFSKPTGCGE